MYSIIARIMSAAFNMYHFTHAGSTLSKCTFNGQQCCNELIVSLVDTGYRALVKSDKFNITAGLATAQNAIDAMRNKTNGIIQ